jgi:hypothetical protein
MSRLGRPGISYHDVENAAESLSKRGEIPSVVSIRRFLGTGSFTTINNHLLSWRLSFGSPQGKK